MKRIIAAVLTLTLVLTTAACGGSGNENKNGHVADRYHDLLDGTDTTYYYEADVEELFLDEEDPQPTESVMAEGRDGSDKHVVMDGTEELEQRQIETADAYYTVYEQDKEYSKEEKEEEDEEDIELKYTGTSEMELNGKTYRYDEYQDEYTMEYEMDESSGGEAKAVSETNVYRKRYLVDDKGELYAILYLNELKGEEGKENEKIYQSIETITKLREGSVPDGIFDIPEDYKEIDMEEEGVE